MNNNDSLVRPKINKFPKNDHYSKMSNSLNFNNSSSPHSETISSLITFFSIFIQKCFFFFCSDDKNYDIFIREILSIAIAHFNYKY